MAQANLEIYIRAIAEGVTAGVVETMAGMDKVNQANEHSASVAEKANQRAAAAARQAASQQSAAHQQAGAAAEQSAMTQAAAMATITALCQKTFSTISAAVDKGIDSYNQYQAAAQGLQSVASFKGISNVSDLLDGLTDQFFDASAAATALKNLLSRGYTADQAVQTITRLKDAAAFGRQANLSLADAVVTATEGIKNENSILVDNAGVTKNVAKMWADWAKANGTTTQSMTQEQKIMAEYSGIMTETAAQVGDLAKMQDTLAGSQASAAQNAEQLSRAFGESMAPSVSAVTDLQGALIGMLGSVVSACPPLTAGLTSASLAMTAAGVGIGALMTASKLKDAFQAAAAGVTVFGVSVNTALPWLLAISAAVGVVAAVVTACKNEAEAEAQAEAALVQAHKDSAQAAEDQAASLDALWARYQALTDGHALSAKEAAELDQVENQLASQHGVMASAAGEAAEANYTLAESYEAARKAGLQELQQSQAQVATDARVAAMKAYADEAATLAPQLTYAADQVAEAQSTLDDALAMGASDDVIAGYREALASTKQGQQELLDGAFSDMESKIKPWLDAALDESVTVMALRGHEVSDEMNGMLRDMVSMAFSGKDFQTPEEATAFVDSTVASFRAAISNADVGDAISAMDKMTDQIVNSSRLGQGLSEADAQAFTGYFQTISTAIAAFGADLGMGAEDVAEMITRYTGIAAKYFTDAADSGQYVLKLDEYVRAAAKDAKVAYAELAAADKAAQATKDSQAVASQVSGYKKSAEAVAGYTEALRACADMQAVAGQDPTVDLTTEAWQKQRDAVKDAVGVEVDSLAALDEAQARAQARRELEEQQLTLTRRSMEENIAATQERVDALSEEINAAGGMATADVDLVQAYIDETSALYDLQDALADQPRAIEDTGDAAANASKGIETLSKRMDALDKAASNVKGFKEQEKAFKTAKKGSQEQTAAYLAMQNAYVACGGSLSDLSGTMDDRADQMTQTVEDFGTAAASELQGVNDDLAYLASGAQDTQRNLQIFGVANVDASQAQAAIASLQSRASGLLAILALCGITPKKSGGGGGGGGGGGSKEDSPYQQAIDDMEHLDKLGKLTAGQELLRLREIGQTVAMTAKERLDWEERIYEATKRLHEAKLDAAYDNADYKQDMGQMDAAGYVEALQKLRRAMWSTMTNEEKRAWNLKYKEALDDLNQARYDADRAAYDHAVAMDEMTLEARVDALEKLKAAAYTTEEQRLSLEEELYDLRKQISEKAYSDALAFMEHEVAMGRMTTGQQIAYLQEVMATYDLMAEQVNEVLEKIHELEQTRLEEQQDDLTQVGNALKTALKNRYTAMRDAEVAALEDSKDAWSNWADETTAAIQAQIDALDKLSDTEDREKTDQEELRKIAKLRQQIQFEQDDYNRAQLQKQLEEAEAAREDRLHKQDIADQKAALKEQMDAAKAEASAAKESLSDQIDAVKDAYAQRMETAALQAEAEQLLMRSTQDELVALIGSYADSYDALGQTLGQKLLDGFTAQVGDIEAYMTALNARVAAMQQAAASAAAAASDAFYQEHPTTASGGVQVNQTVNINQPVESPSEVKRAMRQASEALAAELT